MTNEGRWKAAQQAEKAHQSHSKPTWDADEYLREHFGKDIEFYEGKDILEVGSGTGMIHTLNEGLGEKVAIDPLTHTFADVLGASNAHLTTGMGESLPFRDDSFDVVASHNVLDHCQNPNRVLEETNRVLRDRGHLVFHVNTFSLPKLIRSRLGIIDRPHPYHFSDEETVEMVETAGYEVDSHTTKQLNVSDGSVKALVATTILPLERTYILAKNT